jgi:hypothetical protein
MKAREVRAGSAGAKRSGWRTYTQLEELTKTPTREVRGDSRGSGLDLHAHGGRAKGGGHRRAMWMCWRGNWLRAAGVPPPAGEVLAEATRRRSAQSKTHEIRTWHFLRNFQCGASWTAAALYLPPKAESFWGLRAGHSPAQVPRSGAGGGRRGGSSPPAPAIFAQLLGGRGPLGLPGGPNGPKIGSLWAASWRHSEISSRRADRAAT